MPHILKNQHLEVRIDLPDEQYHFTRFDWTGKIVGVTYKGTPFAEVELKEDPQNLTRGHGFYNEFGIRSPLGYEDAEVGDWFHKIGIGLLKKTKEDYNFHNEYELRPANFQVQGSTDRLAITCQGPAHNGYAYLLKKEIHLLENGFGVHYHLENQGEKPIITDEYNHNFMSIGHAPMGPDYTLSFPFPLPYERFDAIANPEDLVEIATQSVHLKGTPTEPFFFGHLSGGALVPAAWKLEHKGLGLGISETGSYSTERINLWGWGHVISPELFFPIHLEGGQAVQWSRTYEVYELE